MAASWIVAKVLASPLQKKLPCATMLTMAKRNDGAKALATICRDGPARRVVSAACGVTEQAVRVWCEARALPSYRNRVRLRDAYGIALDAWDAHTSTRSTAA